MKNKQPRRTNETGPAGQRAAKNLKQAREQVGLDQDGLAAAVERLGRPMTRQIVSKTEHGDRRLDVDDLVTFAAALRTTPNWLLLTPTARTDRAIEIASDRWVAESAAWLWAEGERPLERSFDAPQLPELAEGERVRRFIQESRPHRTPPGPPDDPVSQNPEVAKALVNLVSHARKAGIDVQNLHYALDLAYHIAGIPGFSYTGAKGEAR